MFAVLFEKCLEATKSNVLFHISGENLGKTVKLIPRIPSEEETAGEEDEVTPRVSLAPTIAKCLSAIGYEADEFYVYKLVNTPKLYKPTKEQVPDADRTSEVWALSPAILKLVYKIRFRGRIGYYEQDYSNYEILEEY